MARREQTPDTATPADESLARWERRSTPFIIGAAIVPLLPVLGNVERDAVSVAVELVAWAVFLVDLAVHVHYRRGYLRTGIGVFDLVVVVGTFPWYLIPGLGGAAVLGLLRLARIARILAVGIRTGPMRRLSQRLGAPAVVVLVSVLVGGAIVTRSDAETFETYGESIWWAFVTVTTVGYGDFTPVSGTGRVTAVLLMLVGVALLGVVAASLASFFSERGSQGWAAGGGDSGQPGNGGESPPDHELVAAIEELRREIASLRAESAPGREPGA